MNLQEIYDKLQLTKDCLIRVSSDNDWSKKVALPSRIHRLLEKNELLKTIDAFFCFDNKPLILFFNLEDTHKKQELHKAIWNFNESPIIIIVENTTVEIFNGFSIDENTKLLKSLGGKETLNDFSYFNLITGKTWEKYQNELSHKNRVDYKLLDNIEAAQKLMLGFGISQTLANALIGKIIFFRYLIDRRVRLNYQGKERLHNNDLCEFLNNKDSFLAFVRHLENKETGFNGDMFKIDPKDYQLINQDALNILIRLLESENLPTGQRSLFDMYDFSILPIEFISNMYEKFIGVDKQDKESAYYTPTFLVDYIIAETVEKHLNANDNNYNCRILDPSCGSGIFLVESLRRIIEKYIKTKKIKNTNTESFREGLKKLVLDNIFGIDKDYNAIQVAIFSVYLTMLDYQESADIEKFKFPNLLGTNFICSDAFDCDNNDLKIFEEKKLQIDCIIGNPPWKRGGVKKMSLCERYLKQRNLLNKIGNKELAQAFVLRSMDFASPNTQCALVLVSKILYNLDGKKFRTHILEHLYINQIFELAPVRKEVFNKSNDPAIAPACILFYKNAYGQPTDKNVIKHISLKPSRFFTMFKLFSLTRNDIQEIQQNRLKEYDWLWKVLVYGSYLDFVFIKRLKTYKSISETINEYCVIKQGYKNKDGSKKIDTTFLKGWPLIQNKKVKPFYYSDKLLKWNKPYVGYIYRDKGAVDTKIYTAPFVMIKNGLQPDLKIVSAVCYTNAIYNDSITSISGINDKKILRNIVGTLNSDISSYQNLLTFSSSGIEREFANDKEKLSLPYCSHIANLVKALEELIKEEQSLTLVQPSLKQLICEQKQKIEQLICKEFDCSQSDLDLIDYAINVSIPMAVKSKGYESIFQPIRMDDIILTNYAQIYIDRFANSFNKNGKHFIVEIHHTSQMIGMIFKVIEEKDFVGEIVHTKNDNASLLALAMSFSSEWITNQLFVQKDIRGFEKNSFYIFKPNERRLWHSAIAHLDVNEFDDAMLRVGRSN